jgi:hypothetical protein
VYAGGHINVDYGFIEYSPDFSPWRLRRIEHSIFDFCVNSIPAVLIIKNKNSRTICFLDDGMAKLLELKSLINSKKAKGFHEMR